MEVAANKRSTSRRRKKPGTSQRKVGASGGFGRTTNELTFCCKPQRIGALTGNKLYVRIRLTASRVATIHQWPRSTVKLQTIIEHEL